MRQCAMLLKAMLGVLAAAGAGAQEPLAPDYVTEADRPFLLNYPNLEDSDGRVVLTNEIVVLQRLVVGAGEWEGIHSHPGNQIYVHIRGGEWSGRLGGEDEYTGIVSPDGEIGWMDEIPLSAEHESGNTGETPIDLIYVTLKTDTPLKPDADHAPQEFPDAPAELLLDNDRMIVQRVKIAPGQWTGIHGHPGNQVYIHITGGSWSERRGGESTPPALMPAGSVGWIEPLDARAGHEVGNMGDATLEFVLVTIK